MKKLQTMKDLLDKSLLESLPAEVMKEMLYYMAIMEINFEEHENMNVIYVVNKDEECELPNYYIERDDEICGYRIKLFIICDAGDGIVYIMENQDHV